MRMLTNRILFFIGIEYLAFAGFAVGDPVISDYFALLRNSDGSVIKDPSGCGGLCQLSLFEGNETGTLDIVFLKNGCCFVTGSETVYLTEPSSPPNTASDIVMMTVGEYNPDNYDVTFQVTSDDEMGLPIPANTSTFHIVSQTTNLTDKLWDSRTLAAQTCTTLPCPSGAPFQIYLN